MKRILFALFFVALDIVSEEKIVYYEKMASAKSSFCRSKESEFFESKAGKGECFDLPYQFETAYKFYTYPESEAIENVQNPPAFYRQLLLEAKLIKKKRQMESDRMENLRKIAYLCNPRFRYPDERPEYFVHLNSVYFISGIYENFYAKGQKYVLCESEGKKIQQRLKNKKFYNPYLIKSISDRTDYFLIYDQKKMNQETSYHLYAVNFSSSDSGRILIQGRASNRSLDRRDNTGIRIIDRKALNQTQTLILNYTTNHLLLFDHTEGKLYSLYKFEKKKKLFLTRHMTLHYVGEHFSYDDQKVFSSAAMNLILIKNQEFQSNDYTILNINKGNISLQDFRPVHELNDLFTLDNEVHIDTSYLKHSPYALRAQASD